MITVPLHTWKGIKKRNCSETLYLVDQNDTHVNEKLKLSNSSS